MKNKFVVAVMVVLLVGLCVFIATKKSTTDTGEFENGDRGGMAQRDRVRDPSSPNSALNKNDVNEPETSHRPLSDIFVDYTKEDVLQAHNQGQRVLLFFYAPWCPTCRGAEQDFKNNFTQFPSDLKIFRVDYDTANELKNRYGITYQHTFVQIDPQGNEITKWQGGGVNTILQNLEK